jgi:hypothetical protein
MLNIDVLVDNGVKLFNIVVLGALILDTFILVAYSGGVVGLGRGAQAEGEEADTLPRAGLRRWRRRPADSPCTHTHTHPHTRTPAHPHTHTSARTRTHTPARTPATAHKHAHPHTHTQRPAGHPNHTCIFMGGHAGKE